MSKFPLNALPEAKPDLNCFQALDYFQTGRAHLLLVSETPGRRGGALGVLSRQYPVEKIKPRVLELTMAQWRILSRSTFGPADNLRRVLTMERIIGEEIVSNFQILWACR